MGVSPAPSQEGRGGTWPRTLSERRPWPPDLPELHSPEPPAHERPLGCAACQALWSDLPRPITDIRIQPHGSLAPLQAEARGCFTDRPRQPWAPWAPLPGAQRPTHCDLLSSSEASEPWDSKNPGCHPAILAPSPPQALRRAPLPSPACFLASAVHTPILASGVTTVTAAAGHLASPRSTQAQAALSNPAPTPRALSWRVTPDDCPGQTMLF